MKVFLATAVIVGFLAILLALPPSAQDKYSCIVLNGIGNCAIVEAVKEEGRKTRAHNRSRGRNND